MSLYRQIGGPRMGWILAALAVGLVVGLAAGLLIWGGDGEEPSLADAVEDLRDRVQPVQLALEQVPIEYSGAVENGRVVAPTEYEATRATAERARLSFDQVEADLAILDAGMAATARAAIARVEDLVAERSTIRAVRAAAADAEGRLESLTRS